MSTRIDLEHVIEPRIVVLDIRRDPADADLVDTDLLYAGNPMRIVRKYEVGSERPSGELVETPRAISDDPCAFRMLQHLIRQVALGERPPPDAPLDLTDEIAEWVASWNFPWPFQPRSDEERRDIEEALDADAVPVEVTAVRHDAPEPGQITCEMVIMGQPGRVVAEIHDAPGERKRTRLIEAPLHALWPRPVIHAVHGELLRLHRAGGSDTFHGS